MSIQPALEDRDTPRGYVTSGRLMADCELEIALSYRRSAHLLFRWGNRFQGREAMRQALRAWRKFRYYRAMAMK